MAGRRSTKPSTRPRRRNVRKAMARKKRSQAKANKDTMFLKVKLQGTLKPSQGVIVSNYLSWFPQLLSATSSYNVTTNPEFLLWCKLYDQVRVNSMTIKCVPRANVLSQDAAQNDTDLTLNGDGLIHTVVDRDDAPPQNISALQRYSSYKPYGVMKTWSRSYGIKYPVDVWLDTSNIFEDETLLKRLGANGGIYVYAENLIEDVGEIFNEPFASVEITYNCVFRGKTMGSLTFDKDAGTVTVKPWDKVTRADDTEPVILTGSLNAVRIDLSGNQVNYADEDLP